MRRASSDSMVFKTTSKVRKQYILTTDIANQNQNSNVETLEIKFRHFLKFKSKKKASLNSEKQVMKTNSKPRKLTLAGSNNPLTSHIQGTAIKVLPKLLLISDVQN